MGMYLDALLLLGAVALIAGIVLTLAAKFMAVPVNETQVKIRECLPGANCGACGFAGCDDYAGALADDPDNVPLNACVPGGAAAASAIAEVLGKDADAAGGGEAKIARVHCRRYRRQEMWRGRSCLQVWMYSVRSLCRGLSFRSNEYNRRRSCC